MDIKIPRKAFIKEHKHLIGLLNKFKSPALRKEAADQAKELKEVVGGAESPITATKTYPDDYPEDVLAVLDAMTLGDGLFLAGSSSLRSQQYAGDYDGYEVVEGKFKSDAAALTHYRKRFQAMIKDLRAKKIYISDIKSGAIKEWEIIPDTVGIKGSKVIGYDAEAIHKRIDELAIKKVLTHTEARMAKELSVSRPTVKDLLKAKEYCKFHVIRWNPIEVARNKKVLRDGRSVTLEETFSQPAITKVDTIALVQRNRFTDFSVIYEFRNGSKVLNPILEDVKTSLKKDIDELTAAGEYFKALKRKFALAKLNKDTAQLERLNKILNSDLGRLYHVVGDIRTLEEVVTDYNKAKLPLIRYEIDQFKSRLANVYALPDYLKHAPKFIETIQRILKMPRAKMAAPLKELGDGLNTILQDETKKLL